MKAWLFQDTQQKRRIGTKAPWSVGWYDPQGRKRSKRIGLKSAATKYARRIEGQLAAGLFENEARASWSEFYSEYKVKVLAGMEPGTRQSMQHCIDHFVRICKPVAMRGIDSRMLAGYVAKRRKEVSKLSGKKVSPATVNKELRHVRAVLRKAHKWGQLANVPEFEFLREPEKLPTYVSPEDLSLIFAACEHAKLPNDQPYDAAAWWRALLVFAYMTGWRINQILMLKRDDVDLDKALAVSRASDNKGKRDIMVPLPALVVEHLRDLTSFSPMMFPWNYNRRTLYHEFQRIQEEGEIKAPDGKQRFGFHDLRRGFATMNADRMNADALQALMQHRDYETTKRYIAMARQLKPAVEQVFVPQLPAPRVAT